MSLSADTKLESDSENAHRSGPSSLSSLPGLRGPDYEVNGSNDCQSDASYYSLTELRDNNPVRRVPAAEVRRQGLAAPAQPKYNSNYPKLFQNHEELPLRVPGPWVKYPLVATGRFTSGEPGPARVIASVHGCGKYDVVYHLRKDRRDFCHAVYRPKKHHHALSKSFGVESESPMHPSMAANGYPMPCHSGYDTTQCVEWQYQGFDQAPWLTPESQWAEPYYGNELQSQYEEMYYPSMAQPRPHHVYDHPAQLTCLGVESWEEILQDEDEG